MVGLGCLFPLTELLPWPRDLPFRYHQFLCETADNLYVRISGGFYGLDHSLGFWMSGFLW